MRRQRTNGELFLLWPALFACVLLATACGADSAETIGEDYDPFAGWGGGAGGADAGTSYGPDAGQGAGGNTNVNLGGTQDFGYFRRLLDDGIVPQPGDFEASGFFAEHHTPLPTPDCGERVCVQGLLGVMQTLFDRSQCTMLQVGLNSPLVADPGARPPLSLVVVVDVSGSMSSRGKLDFVVQGLGVLMEELEEGDELAIVTYSDQASLVAPMREVTSREDELFDVINGLVADGGTNLYDGLQLGFEHLLAHYDSGRQNRVLLLSDGQPTEGETAPFRIREMAVDYTRQGLGLATVGLGMDFDYALMSGLASDGDGTFYFAEDAGAVDEIFEEELSFFTVPVAFDLELEVDAGAAYEIVAVHGTDQWEGTVRSGSLAMPSVFLAHRESDEDVTDDGGRRGGGSALVLELMPLMSMDPQFEDGADVAALALSFREPGTDAVIEQSAVVRYPHAPWTFLDTGFFLADDPAIAQKTFVMLNLYMGIEEACARFHLGDEDEAIAALELLLAATRDYNEEIGDVDIEYDIALVEQLVDVMEDAGGSLPEDIEWSDDPWPAD